MPSHSEENLLEKHVEACQGYLNLGMLDEAWKELETISPLYQTHSEVLQLRTWVLMRKQNWPDALELALDLCKKGVATAILDAAYCLHEMHQTEEARALLLAGSDRLKDFPMYYYNLACYEATLGNVHRAREELRRAIEIDPKYRQEALQDEDLKALWKEL